MTDDRLRGPSSEDIVVMGNLTSKIRDLIAENIRLNGMSPIQVSAVMACELGHAISFIGIVGVSQEEGDDIVRSMIFSNINLGQQQCRTEVLSGIHPYLEATLDWRGENQ